MKHIKTNIHFIINMMPLIIFVNLIIALTLLNNNFISLNTIINLMNQVSVVGIVSIGAMLVIVSGGIDFSSGYGIAMIGMFSSFIYTQSIFRNNISIMILAFVLSGICLGLINGLIITKFNILPFIATLAVMSIAQGLSLFINGGKMTILTDSNFLLAIGHGKIFNIIPISFSIFLSLSIIIYIILKKTKLGIYTYAIGGNENSLWYTGVNVNKYKILIYVIAGLCTGAASMITISQIGMATPSISGTILTDAIAATCIGGTSMSGGKGSVFGTFIGVFIITLTATALTYLNIAAEMQSVFKGCIILFAVSFEAIVNKKLKN